MDYNIDGNPDYGHLTVRLNPGESFIAEGGSMAWMSSGTEVKARLLGGFLPALVRKVTGGESLFVGEYSHPLGGEVTFSPSAPGTIGHRRLSGDSLLLTGGSFMACSPGVNLATRFGGLRSMFSGEGMFLVECSGFGDLFFNTYGALSRERLMARSPSIPATLSPGSRRSNTRYAAWADSRARCYRAKVSL